MKKTRILLKIIFAIAVCYTYSSFAHPNSFISSTLINLSSPPDPSDSSDLFNQSPTESLTSITPILRKKSIYSQLIDEQSKIKDYTSMAQSFATVKIAGLFDIDAYNSMIAAAVYAKDPELAKLVIDTGRLDTAHCKKMIFTAIKDKDYGLAELLFKWMVDEKILNADIIKNIFDKAIKIKEYTFAIMVITIGDCGDFARTEWVFELATKGNQVNADTCANFIKAADKFDAGFEKIGKGFNEAKNRNILTARIYDAAISATDHAGKYEVAQSLFKGAQKNDCVNKFVCGSFISAAGDHGTVEDIENAFGVAVSNKVDNDIVFNIYITALVKKGQIEKAEERFKQRKGYEKYLKPKKHKVLERYEITGGCKKYITKEIIKSRYDFHGLDFATAYIACRLIFKGDDLYENEEVEIIIGKGLHSKDLPVVKKAVELFVSQFQQYIKLTLDMDNSGVAIIKKLSDEVFDFANTKRVIIYAAVVDIHGYHWRLAIKK